MKIVVTGGAGFIGTNLVRSLIEFGHEVVVVDDFSSSPRHNLADLHGKFRMEELDITQDELRPAFHHADAVVHLAARGGVQPSVRDPLKTYEANVIGSIRVLDAALEKDVHQVILASSSSIYGGHDTPYWPSFRECLDPSNPRSPYAASKLAMEQLAVQYARLYDLPTVNLRFFNVYGPWQRANRGSFSAVVPSFIEALLAGRPIKIYGNGEQSRDFTFIGDVVSAIRSVLAHPSDMPEVAKDSRLFNVANAEPKTLHTILSVLEALMGVTAEVEYEPMRAGDVVCSKGDSTRLQGWTGWQALTTLSAGLSETLAWRRTQ